MNHKIAIALLTVRPHNETIKFAESLQNAHGYEMFIFIDDNDYDIEYLHNSSIHMVKIRNDLVESAGYKCSILHLNRAGSRDKSLFYFSHVHTVIFDHIWFIEEDVFIPTTDTIMNIDNVYTESDLLAPNNNMNIDGDTSRWYWSHAKYCHFSIPWASSMICAIRLSRSLLYEIDKYATLYKTLFLDEIMFNTIALHSNLRVDTPIELKGIVWRNDWKLEEILITGLYHPIKNIETQSYFRTQLLHHMPA